MANDARTELMYLIESTPDVSVEAGIFVADHLIANDVVPVVRCKDCKYAYINSFSAAWGVALCKKLSNEAETAIRKQDDFCSYGERREGE